MFNRCRRTSIAESTTTANEQKIVDKKLQVLMNDELKLSRKSKFSSSSKLTKSIMLNSLSTSRVEKSKHKDIEMEVLDNTKEGLQIALRGLEIKLGRLFGEQVGQIDQVLRDISKDNSTCY
jgi:hypothetical protein